MTDPRPLCTRTEQAVGWALRALEPDEEMAVELHVPTCSAFQSGDPARRKRRPLALHFLPAWAPGSGTTPTLKASGSSTASSSRRCLETRPASFNRGGARLSPEVETGPDLIISRP